MTPPVVPQPVAPDFQPQALLAALLGANPMLQPPTFAPTSFFGGAPTAPTALPHSSAAVAGQALANPMMAWSKTLDLAADVRVAEMSARQSEQTNRALQATVQQQRGDLEQFLQWTGKVATSTAEMQRGCANAQEAIRVVTGTLSSAWQLLEQARLAANAIQTDLTGTGHPAQLATASPIGADVIAAFDALTTGAGAPTTAASGSGTQEPSADGGQQWGKN